MGTTTLAVKETASTEQLRRIFAEQKNQIEARLPRGMEADRFIRMAITVSRQLDKPCTPESVFFATLDAAELGLEVQPHLGLVYFVPRWNKAIKQYEAHSQVGYRGLIALAWKTREIGGISAEIVVKGDDFEIELGSDRKLVHKPKFDVNRGDEKNWLGAYATVDFRDGRKPVFTYLTAEKIRHIRDTFAQGLDGDRSPWNTAQDEMWKKTAARQLSKWLPLSTEDNMLVRAAVMDEYHEAGIFQPGAIDVSATPALGPKAPAAAPTGQTVVDVPIPAEAPKQAAVATAVKFFVDVANMRMLIRLPNAKAMEVTKSKALKAKWDNGLKAWIAPNATTTDLAVACSALGLQAIPVDENWNPIEGGQPLGAEATSISSKGTICMEWVDTDVFQVYGDVHENDLHAELKKVGFKLEGKDVYSVPSQHWDDVIAICDRLGYTVQEVAKSRQEPPAAAPAPAPAGPEHSAPSPAQVSPQMSLVQEVRGPKKSSKGSLYLEVSWKEKWFFVWNEDLFETIKASLNKQAVFILDNDPKYQKLVRILKIGDREFDEKSLPIIDVNEPRGGKTLF